MVVWVDEARLGIDGPGLSFVAGCSGLHEDLRGACTYLRKNLAAALPKAAYRYVGRCTATTIHNLTDFTVDMYLSEA
jgi:hypothetical protein